MIDILMERNLDEKNYSDEIKILNAYIYSE